MQNIKTKQSNINDIIYKINRSLEYYNHTQDRYVLKNDYKIDIVFKDKSESTDWSYCPAGNFKLVYEIDEITNKSILTIKSIDDKVQTARVGRLYNSGYIVTEYGIVISTNSLKVRRLNKNHKGYLVLTLSINTDSKTCFSHRLVAHAFCPRPEHLKDVPYNKLQVNHKDGNKENNHFTNLEWCTNQENMDHSWETGIRIVKMIGEEHHQAKLTNQEAKEIREDYIKNLRPYKYYQDSYNVSVDVIQTLLYNKTYIDPSYVVPESIGKRKIGFTDATWIRQHKEANPNTDHNWYANKFVVDKETIGRIIRNEAHVDPNFNFVIPGREFTSIEKVKSLRQCYKDNKDKMSIKDMAKELNIKPDNAYDIIYNKSFYDSDYDAPDTPKKSSMNHEKVRELREHKITNPTTHFSYYMNKYDLKHSAICAILNNVNYYDSNYVPYIKYLDVV